MVRKRVRTRMRSWRSESDTAHRHIKLVALRTLRSYGGVPACRLPWMAWDFCPTLAGRAFALHVGALLLSCSSRQGASGVVLRILSFDLSPEKIHQTSAILYQPWALRRAAEVMHRATFLSNTREMLLRPILENGTIRTAIKNCSRNQSVWLITSGLVTYLLIYGKVPKLTLG